MLFFFKSWNRQNMWVTNLWYNNERICVQKMSTSLDKKQNNLLINELKPSTSLALHQGGGINLAIRAL